MPFLFGDDEEDVFVLNSQTARPRKLPVVEVLASEDVQAMIDRLAAAGGGTVVVTGAGAFVPKMANGVDLLVNPPAEELARLRSLMGTR
jgi:hypothetical protein